MLNGGQFNQDITFCMRVALRISVGLKSASDFSSEARRDTFGVIYGLKGRSPGIDILAY